jgi:hypothetical protein
VAISGGCALPGTFELCDGAIEPLGVLVSEFSQKGANLNPPDSKPFVSTVLWPSKTSVKEGGT